MKKVILIVSILIGSTNSFSQSKHSSECSNTLCYSFLTKTMGIKDLIGFSISNISRDSLILKHVAYYNDSGKQIQLYDKQVDSLLNSLNFRARFYLEIRVCQDTIIK